ncbi:MAG: pilin protein [Selenomonadaceae bacterium]|nr:pilin protein [Selenomonadaceae bacterium]MBP3721634.1 pilin protein [Selenomonadaceae bacterium]
MKLYWDYFKARYLSSMDEKGQGIVEYALILAFVVVVAAAIGNSGALKDKVKGAFDNTASLFAS